MALNVTSKRAVQFSSADSAQNAGDVNAIPSEVAEVFEDFKDVHSKSVWWVLWYNITFQLSYIWQSCFNFFTSLFDSSKELELHHDKHKRRFTNLIYLLIQYGVIESSNDIKLLFTSAINRDRNIRSLSEQCKIDILNKVLAKIIYHQDFVRIQKNQGLGYFQIILLKRAYYAWVRALDSNDDFSHKFYIQRAGKSQNEQRKPFAKNYKLEYLQNGVPVYQKNFNFIKIIFFWQANLAIVFTALAQGLVPAVLAATPATLVSSIIFVGIPSIAINYVLVNVSVKSLIRDIWYNRLLTDDGGNTIWESYPLFIISLCGGITYGAMAFTTSYAAYTALFTALAPMLTVGLSAILLNLVFYIAFVSAIYVCISFSALFFSSMIEIIRDGILNELKKFILSNFIDIFNEPDNNLIYSTVLALYNFAVYLVLLISALYITVIETSLLYSMALGLVPIAPLAFSLVLIAAPANAIFTFKVFNYVYNAFINLPWSIVNFYNHLCKAYNNPIQLYETLSWALGYTVLSFLNFISSKAEAQGVAQETMNTACKDVLGPLGIDASSRWVQSVSQVTEFLDYGGGNQCGAGETLDEVCLTVRRANINILRSYQEVTSGPQKERPYSPSLPEESQSSSERMPLSEEIKHFIKIKPLYC